MRCLSRSLSLIVPLVACTTALWMRVGAAPLAGAPPAGADEGGAARGASRDRWSGLAQRPDAPTGGKPRFTAASGFAVEEVYPAEKSDSVVALTFDSDGELVIAREKGPVVRLLDRDEDGRPESEQVVTDRVTNCHGLLFEGHDLLAVGEGPNGTGLYRVRDANGDGAGERVEMITLNSGEIGEHGPHAVIFGPDGFVYWMLGNHTNIVPSPDPLSPHQGWKEGQLLPSYTDARGHAAEIRAPGGIVLRRNLFSRAPASPDWELVNGGFRNAYDHAFNLAGELFTFDSDMEWDIGLPWYRPVRTNHLAPGGEFGWRTGSGKWPDYYPDSLPGMTDIGRGSPVGVVFYQSDAYPEEYRGAFLVADWSRGRILAGFLQKAGATYTEKQVDFVLGTPLNVTDLDVGPDGNVYFSKGGRSTEGGIYRVVHRPPARTPAADARRAKAEPIERALTQAEPRSAWGRAAIRRAREDAGEDWSSGLREVVTSESESAERRVRALELLQVHGEPPDETLLQSLGKDRAWEMRAASTYYLGLHRTGTARRELVRRLKDAEPFVRRRAAEALVRTGIHTAVDAPLDPVADILPLLADEDRFVRYAARELLERVNRNRWRRAAFALDAYPAATEALLALVHTSQVLTEIRPLLERELALLERGVPDAQLPAFLRVVHLTLLRDEGVRYSEIYDEMAEILLPRLAEAPAPLNREIARTLAYLGTTEAIPEIVGRLQEPGASHEDQIFYMYCLRTMTTGWEPEQRKAVVDWFKKTQDESWKGGASFIGYLQYLWNDFSKLLSDEERAAATKALPSFHGERLTTSRRRQRPRDNIAAFSEQELKEYLLWDPMAYTGDPADGQAAYEKALCVTCHRVGDIGQSAGPDLTDVARRFQRADLLDAILHPSKTISDQWASAEVVTKDEKSYVGVISTENGNSLTVVPVDGSGAVTIPKSQIVSRKAATTSPMPEGLLNTLSLDEIADLFAFLEKPPAQ
ncbi:MAG: HEAT repeat domain-containing protein [Vicinamibacteraceae bacterium]